MKKVYAIRSSYESHLNDDGLSEGLHDTIYLSKRAAKVAMNEEFEDMVVNEFGKDEIDCDDERIVKNSDSIVFGDQRVYIKVEIIPLKFDDNAYNWVEGKLTRDRMKTRHSRRHV